MKYLLAFYISLIIYVNVTAQQLKDGYTASIVADGLNPVAMTIDHHGRLWLAEKDGRVLIINENEEMQSEPFVIIEVDEFNERGLMGIVLHPDTDDKPYLYVYYTVPKVNRNRVSRFMISGNFAAPGSEEIILELDALSGSIHNGGAMVFDTAGYLFIATGDSGLSSNAQDSTNLLGKILRITEEGEIPESNPFFDELEGKNKAIWSFGHRNPYNLAYDPVEDVLYSSDVGAGDYEEINRIYKGANYGWPILEGPNKNASPLENYEDPFYFYDHSRGCAIVGLAHVPRHNQFLDQEIKNSIIYADYCKGFINYLENGDTSEHRVLAEDIERPLNILFDTHSNAIFIQTRSGLGGGSQQDNTSTSQGKLWKLSYSGNGSPTVVVAPENKTIARGESVFFDIGAVGSTPLSYEWYVQDTFFKTTNSDTLFLLETTSFTDSTALWCVVSNEEGRDTSSLFYLILVEGRRPSVFIELPSEGKTYKAGDTIWYSGYVTDDEDGLISEELYSWTINFHHDLHTHPFVESIEGISAGYFVVPTVGEPDTNVWLRVSLTGMDHSGLTATGSRDIYPRFNRIHITSNFGGKVNIDGILKGLPFDLKSTISLERTMEVPEQQLSVDHLLLFSHWEDGSTERLRKFKVREHFKDTMVAYFDTIRLGDGHGLYGEYYNNPHLQDEVDLVRLDSMINFNWGQESPEESVLNEDNFSIRWRAYVEPLFSESFVFYLTTDDGVRMWLDEELVVDDWMNHPPKEHIFESILEANKKYKIVVEYFESGGGALAKLEWSSPNTRRDFIPKRQLFPIEFGHLHGRIWYDENRDGEIQSSEEFVSEASIVLLDENNNVVKVTEANDDGFFAFRDYEVGNYRILLIPSGEYAGKDFGYGLTEGGYSSIFMISANELIEERYALVDNLPSRTEDQAKQRLRVFPNPVLNTLFIDDKNYDYEEVLIFGVDGALIQHLPKTDKINFSGIDPGLYFIQIKGEKMNWMGKVRKL